jgi:hypothetical protein
MAEQNGVTTYEIIKALSQAASVYDGAHDEKGEPIKAGLKREDGNPILDSRCVDGFKVKFQGNVMVLMYHTEALLHDIHKMGAEKYENEIEGHIKDIVNFIKKDYKNHAKGSVSLTQEGETDIVIEPISRVRTSVRAIAKFKIGGIKEMDEMPGKRPERDDIKKHNELGGLDSKKKISRENLKEAVQPYSADLVRQLQNYLSVYFNYSKNTKDFFEETRATELALQPTGRLGDAKDRNSTQYLINWMRSTRSPKTGKPYLYSLTGGTIDQRLQSMIKELEKYKPIQLAIERGKQATTTPATVAAQAPAQAQAQVPAVEKDEAEYYDHM